MDTFLQQALHWLFHPAVAAGLGLLVGWIVASMFASDRGSLKRMQQARDRERAEADAAAGRLQRELKEMGSRSEEQREVLQFLPDLIRQLFTASGPRTIGPLALDLVEQLLAPAQSAFLIARASERKLVLTASRNLPATAQPGLEVGYGQGRLGQVAQTLVTTDEPGFRGAVGARSGGAQGAPRGPESSGLQGLRAEVVAPLIDGPKLLGVIGVGTPRRRRGQEKRLLSMAAELTAAALVHAERMRVTDRFDQSDGLTGVLCRGYFLERFEQALEQAHRSQGPLSVVLLDIDEFRHYNQSQGHEKGDEVLRQLGALLRGTVREEDLVGRWGGEEFAIVYRGTPKETALRLADEVRQKVAAHRFPEGIYQPGGAVTVSGGVACFPEDSRKAENLIRCAEGGVSEAKRQGRNTIVAARPDFLT